MNIELWRNVKIVDTSATATKRLIKMIAVGLVTAILLGTTIGHTKTMDNTEIEYLKKRIKKHEGYRELPYNLEYKTTDGKVVKENFSTAGYGHVIQEGEVEPEGGYTKAYWEGVFEKDFKNAHDGALKLLGDSNVHPTAVGIVTEMIYQMGYNGVSKFTNTLKLIKDGRYQDASIEMLDSKWAQQTEGRAIDLSKIMKSLEANIQ
tara:strand:- start:895 stop:1509 length:615 start_codon:yes stop_codon:yes gene_type:complete